MLQRDVPEDYVIATGESWTLQEFVAEAFNAVGLDWRDHVMSDPLLLRPSEIMVSRGNPEKARQDLGWQAKYRMHDVVRMMMGKAAPGGAAANGNTL
jgi:GDPmannose 4,6-dehydratase